ncbi:MAG: DUF5752 family protein [Candidatus Woesearchaeota archaeon]
MKKKHTSASSKKKAAHKPKKINTKLLENVPQEKCFILLGGKTLHSLPQLIFELDEMPEHVFKHHVSEGKNDFANWIRHVIGEIELADKLMGIDTKKDAQLVMLKHLLQHTR